MVRSIFAVALAGALALAAVLPAQAAQGRKKSLLTGAAIGAAGALAVGVIGSKMLGGQPAQAAEEEPAPRTTGSVRPTRVYQNEPSCRLVPTKLYTEDGTYVKTERLEVCR